MYFNLLEKELNAADGAKFRYVKQNVKKGQGQQMALMLRKGHDVSLYEVSSQKKSIT